MSKKTGWLWDEDWKPAPHSEPTTSKEAADSMAPTAGTLRKMVLDYVHRCGTNGATDEEITAALDLQGNTARPRRWELAEQGLIVKSGERRKTSSGRSAAVWVRKP